MVLTSKIAQEDLLTTRQRLQNPLLQLTQAGRAWLSQRELVLLKQLL